MNTSKIPNNYEQFGIEKHYYICHRSDWNITVFNLIQIRILLVTA